MITVTKKKDVSVWNVFENKKRIGVIDYWPQNGFKYTPFDGTAQGPFETLTEAIFAAENNR